jgi:hypothetical protein
MTDFVGALRQLALRRTTFWPYLRAALITLTMLSQCVSALPKRPLDAAQLARPEARRNMRWLAVALRPFGERGPAELERWVIELSRGQVALRSRLLDPIAPLIHATAVRQQWHLFLTVKEQVYRLRIDAQSAQTQAGAWRTVYRTNQTDLLGMAEVLDYRRLRGVYNPTRAGAHAQYPAFVDWLMQRVWSEHPELGALRVGMEQLHVGSVEASAQHLGLAYVVERERPRQP